MIDFERYIERLMKENISLRKEQLKKDTEIQFWPEVLTTQYCDFRKQDEIVCPGIHIQDFLLARPMYDKLKQEKSEQILRDQEKQLERLKKDLGDITGENSCHTVDQG